MGGAFGKCCQTHRYSTVWNRPSVRKVVSDRSDRSAHFRTSADSDEGASSCYKPFSRSVRYRLLRLFTSIDIKIERSVFGDRSKRPTEPTHFRTLWVRSDQTPPTFRPFTERVFLCGLTDRIKPIVVSERTRENPSIRPSAVFPNVQPAYLPFNVIYRSYGTSL
jgi:hypothetical protein